MRAIPRVMILLMVLNGAQAFGETPEITSPAPRQKDISVSISDGYSNADETIGLVDMAVLFGVTI